MAILLISDWFRPGHVTQLWPVRWKGKISGRNSLLPEKDGRKALSLLPLDAPGYDWVTWKLQQPLSQVSYAEYNPHVLRVGEQWDRKLMLRHLLNKIINFLVDQALLSWVSRCLQTKYPNRYTGHLTKFPYIPYIRLVFPYISRLIFIEGNFDLPTSDQKPSCPTPIPYTKNKLFKIKLYFPRSFVSYPPVKFHFLMFYPHDLQFTAPAGGSHPGIQPRPFHLFLLVEMLSPKNLARSSLFHDTFYGQYIYIFQIVPYLLWVPLSWHLPYSAIWYSYLCAFLSLASTLWALGAEAMSYCSSQSVYLLPVWCFIPSGSSKPPRWMLQEVEYERPFSVLKFSWFYAISFLSVECLFLNGQEENHYNL